MHRLETAANTALLPKPGPQSWHQSWQQQQQRSLADPPGRSEAMGRLGRAVCLLEPFSGAAASFTSSTSPLCLKYNGLILHSVSQEAGV